MPSPSPLVALGSVVGLALLIAAVWVSGASAATSLAVTAVLVLIAVALLAAAAQAKPQADPSADQRDRMGDKVP